VAQTKTTPVTPKAESPTVSPAIVATPEEAVRAAAFAAAGLGVPGVFHPGIDEAGMGAIWLTMTTTIAKRCGASISPATAGKLVAAALSSVAAYSIGSKILSWGVIIVFSVIPAAGIPAAAVMNAGLNALFTCRLGRECIRRFSDPNFTSADVIELGRLMVLPPGWTEIRDIKRMLTA
jgi:uncharacterized protein (DUF697 family)